MTSGFQLQGSSSIAMETSLIINFPNECVQNNLNALQTTSTETPISDSQSLTGLQKLVDSPLRGTKYTPEN